MPRVQSKSPVTYIQSCMNACRGRSWFEKRNEAWRNFLKVRNRFIKKILAEEGLSALQLKDKEEEWKNFYIGVLVNAFMASFFEYSRDNGWMQEAVGDTDDWMNIEGMATWHVKGALAALEKRDEDEDPASSGPQAFSEVFDPVRDAAGEQAVGESGIGSIMETY